ncbi:hypothetical protein WMY93_022511 [Mugilogobius chulae]|uniref:Uncharacterized protein n=1 Tax=Mugilogobius chulae TaxID=88201 RepID=A0AAW0NJH7_9GOBI
MSKRLTVTKNCSLQIQNVQSQDAGLFYCRQYNKSGHLLSDDPSFENYVYNYYNNYYNDNYYNDNYSNDNYYNDNSEKEWRKRHRMAVGSDGGCSGCSQYCGSGGMEETQR